jgi:hypothetical protein
MQAYKLKIFLCGCAAFPPARLGRAPGLVRLWKRLAEGPRRFEASRGGSSFIRKRLFEAIVEASELKFALRTHELL